MFEVGHEHVELIFFGLVELANMRAPGQIEQGLPAGHPEADHAF